MGQYSSFVRQLNFYGFSKVRNLKKNILYRHPMFKEGQKHLISGISRKKRIQKKESQNDRLIRRMKVKEYKAVFKGISDLEARIQKLEDDNKEIEAANKTLSDGLADFNEEWKRRTDKYIRSFCMIGYNFNYSMIKRICKFFIDSGFSPFKSCDETPKTNEEEEPDFETMMKYAKTRVQKLIFYRNEAENHLDPLFNLIVNGDKNMTENEDMEAYFQLYKKEFYRVMRTIKSAGSTLDLSQGANSDNTFSEMDEYRPDDLKQKNQDFMLDMEKISEVNYNSRSIKLEGLNFSDNESMLSFGGIFNQFEY